MHVLYVRCDIYMFQKYFSPFTKMHASFAFAVSGVFMFYVLRFPSTQIPSVVWAKFEWDISSTGTVTICRAFGMRMQVTCICPICIGNCLLLNNMKRYTRTLYDIQIFFGHWQFMCAINSYRRIIAGRSISAWWECFEVILLDSSNHSYWFQNCFLNIRYYTQH